MQRTETGARRKPVQVPHGPRTGLTKSQQLAARKLVAKYQSHDFGSEYHPASLKSTFTPTAKVAEFLAPAPLGITSGEWLQHPLRSAYKSADLVKHPGRDTLTAIAATVPTERWAVRGARLGARAVRVSRAARRSQQHFDDFIHDQAKLDAAWDISDDWMADFKRRYPGFHARDNPHHDGAVVEFSDFINPRRALVTDVATHEEKWLNHPAWADVETLIAHRKNQTTRAYLSRKEKVKQAAARGGLDWGRIVPEDHPSKHPGWPDRPRHWPT